LSIRSSWQSNRSAYQQLSSAGWRSNNELADRLIATRIGLTTMRTNAIWRLTELLGSTPAFFESPDVASWGDWRKTLLSRLIGIGRAKVSFALEMCFPAACRVICIDTHIQQLYGLAAGGSLNERTYDQLESHWLRTCATMGYPPAIVRHILWDARQGQVNTRYWSDVFETSPCLQF